MLVAEDSITVREMLVALLSTDPEIHVVGQARDGAEAVELATALRPDVIVMDIHMPRLDGLEATKRIMTETPTPIVIVTASEDARAVEVSMNALRAGALTILPKPLDGDAAFVRTVKDMVGVAVVRRREIPARPSKRRRGPCRLVVLAASTGGPAALYKVFSKLPGDFPAPLAVVQHIAPGFVDGLAGWLAGGTMLRVKVADEGDPLQPGGVYVAPDDRHLRVTEELRASLSKDAPIAGLRPAADALFRSAAAFGSSCLAVVLSGMGRDGVDGARAIRDAGGQVIAQDAATSVVYGMPKAVVEEGLSDGGVPIDGIAAAMLEVAYG